MSMLTIGSITAWVMHSIPDQEVMDHIYLRFLDQWGGTLEHSLALSTLLKWGHPQLVTMPSDLPARMNGVLPIYQKDRFGYVLVGDVHVAEARIVAAMGSPMEYTWRVSDRLPVWTEEDHTAELSWELWG